MYGSEGNRVHDSRLLPLLQWHKDYLERDKDHPFLFNMEPGDGTSYKFTLYGGTLVRLHDWPKLQYVMTQGDMEFDLINPFTEALMREIWYRAYKHSSGGTHWSWARAMPLR
jgi:hypothetical protein